MITLVLEVVYYRRRDALENAVQPVNSQNQTPPPSYDGQVKRQKLFRHENVVTLGGEKFIPASLTQNVPFVPAYARRSLRSADEHEYIE